MTRVRFFVPSASVSTLKDSRFVSTVANLEAFDHVFLFNDPDHIRSTIRSAGLEIVDDRAMRLPGDKSTELVPYNYAAVVRRAS